MIDLEANKKAAVGFYQTAFDGDPSGAIARYLGDRYVQHSLGVRSGPEGFIVAVEQLRSGNPDFKLEIKRVIAEGDMVVIHAHLTIRKGERGRVLADVFRLEDGKVVEHRDVIQERSGDEADGEGMF